MNAIEKLANKLELPEEEIKNIIIAHHELEYLTPKKQLKKVDVRVTDETEKLLKKISGTLKVSESAIVKVAIQKELEREGLDGK